jgi:hypothetical protein
MAATSRTTSSDLALLSGDEFGDRKRKRKRRKGKRRSKEKGLFGGFGNAIKRRLKRPYQRKVVRKGRALKGHHKIGHVTKSARNKFAYVTRGGSVYEASVSKGRGKRKAARKGRRK